MHWGRRLGKEDANIPPFRQARHGWVRDSSASLKHGWFYCGLVGLKVGQLSQHDSGKPIHPLSAGDNLVGRPSVISLCHLSLCVP